MSDLKIFAKTIEPEAVNQIYEVSKLPIFADSQIRIMPDAHKGAGCVIGFTANVKDHAVPNLIGVDIGCGMLCVPLGKAYIDFKKLDDAIRRVVPSGMNNHKEALKGVKFDPKTLWCYDKLKNQSNFILAVGTLGGGNHFVEVDIDDDGNMYLIIHSGSRNMGHQVASFYQDLAIKEMSFEVAISNEINRIIAYYKKLGQDDLIQDAIKFAKANFKHDAKGIPTELRWLSGDSYNAYMHDMKICQEYAVASRFYIAVSSLRAIGRVFNYEDSFETIHNYIDDGQGIIRKGAIDASADKRLLIPINMRDGCIMGIGKGNPDWNYSAPHGACRLMSRSEAKKTLDMGDYKKSMSGIFTTSVVKDTLDEAPMAYKYMSEIVDPITDTLEIQKIIKPVYNFKAAE